MSRLPTPKLFSALFALSLSLSLAAGCPGGGGEDGGVNDGGSAEPTARDALLQAIADMGACAENDPIRSIYPDLPPESSISGRIYVLWELPAVDMDDDLSLREEETFACAALIQSFADPCDVRGFHDAGDEVYEACDSDRLVQGAREAGADCTDNRYACQGFCAYDRDTGCGSCADLVAEGESCEDSLRCVSGTECRVIGDDGPTCLALSELGEACGSERDCVAGAYCNNDDVCETYRAPGDSCEDDSRACEFGCLSGDGERRCTQPRTFTEVEEGQACRAGMGPESASIGCDYYGGVTCLVDNEDTGEGVCTAFEFQEPGEPCDGPWSIAMAEFTWGNRLCGNDPENYCHYDWELASPDYVGECRRRPVEGERCESAGFSGATVPCAQGFFCRADGEGADVGECVPEAVEGEACMDNALDTYDWGCAVGLSCDWEHANGPTCISWEDIDDGQPMCTEV